MGEGKRADFGRPLLGGLGDGEDCLIKGLLRTVPIAHLARFRWSWLGEAVGGDEVYRVDMGIKKDSRKSCKHQHQLNLQTRSREKGANQGWSAFAGFDTKQRKAEYHE